MGTLTITGAIIMITGWFSLVEFDHFPESERKQILQKIKRSPAYIALIALLPIGIVINRLGSKIGSVALVVIGATLIFLQGIIVASLFWKRKRWKSILLLSVIGVLGVFMYIPLFL